MRLSVGYGSVAPMTVGDTIRSRRIAKGMSIRGLGKLLGVAGSAVAQWESGESNPTMDNRVKLSNVLELPILDLLPDAARRPQVTSLTPDELILIGQYRRLPAQFRETYLRLLIVQAEGLSAPP